MNFLKSIWTKVAGGAIALIAILLYVLNLKQKEINSLKAKAELAKTQKEVDKIEHEIDNILRDRASTKKELDEANEALVALTNRKAELHTKAENRTKDEVEKYWNNDE